MKKKLGRGISTFQSADSAIEGDIEFDGTIRLDGQVKGKIQGNRGTLIIGEKARIEADIFVDVAVIMGRVDGTIEAGNRLEVRKPACIRGNISAPVISIEAGVSFKGNCSMNGGRKPVNS